MYLMEEKEYMNNAYIRGRRKLMTDGKKLYKTTEDSEQQ